MTCEGFHKLFSKSNVKWNVTMTMLQVKFKFVYVRSIPIILKQAMQISWTSVGWRSVSITLLFRRWNFLNVTSSGLKQLSQLTIISKLYASITTVFRIEVYVSRCIKCNFVLYFTKMYSIINLVILSIGQIKLK